MRARGVPLLTERLMAGEQPRDQIDQLAKSGRANPDPTPTMSAITSSPSFDAASHPDTHRIDCRCGFVL